MTWCWFAHLPSPPAGEVWAGADVEEDGRPPGLLVAWPAGRKPVAAAVRADARIVDLGGAEAEVSLLVLPRDRSPLFDDPAVSGALRAVLAGPPADAVSTFVRDSSHFAGAVPYGDATPPGWPTTPWPGWGRSGGCGWGPGCSAPRAAARPGDPALRGAAVARRRVRHVTPRRLRRQPMKGTTQSIRRMQWRRST